MNSRLVFGTIVTVIILIAVVWWLGDTAQDAQPTVSTFDECVAAGNPLMESYPAQCQANGQTFIQDIGNELEKSDLITIDSPRPTTVIDSPLQISGKARGSWYFEGSFPVVLEDDSGNELATGIATAEGEWMTDEFVPFSATLTFDVPTTNQGELLLKKDNPSGLPENDDLLRVPVRFE